MFEEFDGPAASGAPGDSSLVQGVSDWLIDRAFDDSDILEILRELCERLCALGIPLERVNLSWSTLHPMIEAESVIWQRGSAVVLESFPHADFQREEWLQSPLRYVIDNDLPALRRRLTGPEALLDFPLLVEFAKRGGTDYVLLATRFLIPRAELRTGAGEMRGGAGGIVVSWMTSHPGGFTNRHLAVLERLQRRLALTCKSIILARITRNIANAYLGRIAASRVLSGQIRHGDGDTIDAVVWYSDLRNSTALAETMPRERYLSLLNIYFHCTAGAALAAGGEVLDFIGDAVLAIFPYRDSATRFEAIRGASQAIGQADTRRREALDADPDLPLDFGIGVDAGTVVFGNIGVPERLAFSVIGPTVNQVARIEKLTKETGATALATLSIAEAAPGLWRPAGARQVQGLSAPLDLYAWIGGEGRLQ